MIDPDSPKPTVRSGSLCSSDSNTSGNSINNPESELHAANATPQSHPHNEVLLNHGAPASAMSPPPSSSSSSRPGSAHAFPATTDWVQNNENVPPLYLSHHYMPSLQIRTDVPPTSSPMNSADPMVTYSVSSAGSSGLPPRTPSFRGLRAARNPSTNSLSPAASVLSSPQLLAMGDITPLPSPIGGATPWRPSRNDAQPLSRTPSTISRPGSSLSLRLSESSHRFGRSTSRSRTRPYTSGEKGERAIDTSIPAVPAPRHTRNRSLSDYVPPGRSIPIKPRPIVASGSGAPHFIGPSSSIDDKSNGLHREQYLAVQRGIAFPAARPLTPPRSSRGADDEQQGPVVSRSASLGDSEEVYSVRSIRSQQPRKYRKLCQLGQGTFSQVNLAARMELDQADGTGDLAPLVHTASTSQKLVAVKVIEYGPAGGADEERLEVSLKREVDILKTINHPSVVQLKAFGSDEKRALLVLDYCPGGDLFDVASSSSRPMSPSLTRRIFAELVAAVRYLHQNFIVHRDIKLENVLVTIPSAAMHKPIDWRTYDRAVVTLSDLGLSRRIPEPPESPLLHTRCGSEDYAAPEILMGQAYDGRSTDAWALGVSLYAMMENRLPFDALPGTRGDPAKLRARTPHRIARCEWGWYRYADSDEEWDPEKGKDWGEAHECVEGLLKRNTRRKTLDEIAAIPWVRDAIDVPGGLKRGDQEVP
ncbi:putative protein kinase [Aspergillus chevalieri]|uniref:Protein kinase domain-containing protein n=1 Tax=Aspergillus chevalieri TaxID=182096 RepID=A0A7R7VRA5_ASPCH|nr:uncharacterized protein ACHE_50503A [Aspergillus chevalieri]BCR89305.1 hypothetical protein ACHE_50503A [Aspergillus chevalieri]